MYYCAYIEYIHIMTYVFMYKDSNSPGCKIATRVLMPLSCKFFLLPSPFLPSFNNISSASLGHYYDLVRHFELVSKL